MPEPIQSFLLMLLAAGILAVLAGGPAIIYWWKLRSNREGVSAKPLAALFPKEADWVVPWSGWAILIVFATAFLVPTLVQIALGQSGFYGVLYGPDFPQKMTVDDWKDPVRKQAAHLRGLWSQSLAIPLLLVLIVGGLRLGSKATLPQIGLSRKRWQPNLLLGYLGWIVLAPLAFVVFVAAIALFAPNPDKHPLLDLGDQAATREWIVFALQAALFAPVLEELLFRGLFLPWLIQSPERGAINSDMILPPRYRPHLCYAVALLFSLQSPSLADALQAGRWLDVIVGLAPCFFLVLLLPIFLLLPCRKRLQRWLHVSSPEAVRGWFASAVLFAAIHSNVWPSPIPLFVLALGLGWLAIRTRSIVPSIVVHMMFNAVAVVYLCLGGS